MMDEKLLGTEYKIKGSELVDVTGFIAEACEIIDSLVTGDNRTYKQLSDMGVIIKPVRRFMEKHKKFLPVTQAMVNQKERTKEAQERVNADTDNDTIEVEPHNGSLERMSRIEESK